MAWVDIAKCHVTESGANMRSQYLKVMYFREPNSCEHDEFFFLNIVFFTPFQSNFGSKSWVGNFIVNVCVCEQRRLCGVGVNAYSLYLLLTIRTYVHLNVST